MSVVRDENFVDILKKYKPDMVLSSHIFGDQENSLIRQAKKMKISTLAIINSWDKLTSRHIIRILPDFMVVHNEVMKQEALKHADMKSEKILIVGVPHYDDFINKQPRPKDFLYSKFNISPDKKILLFCPTGQYYSSNDVNMINMLITMQKSGKIDKNLQIFLRFPPNDNVDLGGIVDKNSVIYYQPGIRFSSKRGIDWDMDAEDIQLLHDMLFWSSVIICPPSSISVDASILDKPIINLKFMNSSKYTTDNIDLYYESDHYKKILEKNGISLVSSEDELAKTINDYMKNPSICSEGRKAIAREQCWKLDGRSSMRMRDAVRDILFHKNAQIHGK